MAYLGRSFDLDTMKHSFLVAIACCHWQHGRLPDSQLSETPSAKSAQIADMKRATDHHSYSRPEEAV